MTTTETKSMRRQEYERITGDSSEQSAWVDVLSKLHETLSESCRKRKPECARIVDRGDLLVLDRLFEVWMQATLGDLGAKPAPVDPDDTVLHGERFDTGAD